MIFPFSFLLQIEAQTLNHLTNRAIHYLIFSHILHLWLNYIHIQMQSNRSLPGIINDLNIGVKRQLSHMPPDFGDVLPNKIETVEKLCR